MPRRAPEYDAIVVGSGMTGGWAAKELTELGLRTLVLDAGRPIVPNKDYREHTPPWAMPFRGLGDRQAVARRQAVQRNSVTFDEMSHQFWVDDVDNPYSTPANKAFHWFRARQVGGKSIIWGRQVYRWSDLDFEANLRDGIGVDWPIRYADIAPWYDLVERFIGVSGQTEGLAHLPDGPFLPPMAMNCVESHVRDRMASKFGRDRVLTMGRVAVLTERHNGRAACHYCGPCHRGCVTRSYFSSVNATLPAAEATGRLTLMPDSIARHLVYDDQTNRVSGVLVLDARTRETREYTARVVFLCASALESARILLNSATSRHPDGLANSSGQVGRNVMDHIKWGGASGTFDGWSDRQPIGQRPNGIYIPRFRNVTTRHPRFHSRLRISGWRGARRVGGESQGAGHRACIQGRPNAARPLDDELRWLRRDAAASRESGDGASHARRRVGDSRAAHHVRVERQRAGHSSRHERDRGRAARGGGREGHPSRRSRAEHAGQHESRDGDGAHGARPEDVGAERLESELGRA